METLDVVPALVDLQAAAEEMRQAELRRNQARLRSLTPPQQAAVEAITRGLMNKFLHQPLKMLKAAAREGDAAMVEAIRAAFQRAESREDAEGAGSENVEPSQSGEPANDVVLKSGESEPLISKR
jgi:glutamyl-tRNA reductase